MANTTFSGPVRAGTIRNTTGSTLGSDIANIGNVVMSQSAIIDVVGASATTTVATIPAFSTITRVSLICTIFNNDSGAATVSVGNGDSATAYLAATSIKSSNISTDMTTQAQLALAQFVGSTDIQVIATFAAGSGDGDAGNAYVLVEYVQYPTAAANPLSNA